MYSEEMESFGVYEDLSLFNGDLLLEDASLPVVAQQQGLIDGPSIHEAVPAPTPKASVQVTLAHPQNGSQELGLQDLLVASPTQDLPDPFTTTSAWFDTKTDLLDMLTGVEVQPQQCVDQIAASNLLDPTAALSSQETSVESLEAIQALLLADLPMEVTPDQKAEPQVDTSSSIVVYDNTTTTTTLPLPVASDAELDILEELNHAGLEQLLANAPDPNTASLFDAPQLSPVSADDIDSLLSSTPPSPSEDTSLASLFGSFSSEPATLDNRDVEDILHVGPQRPVREKARTAPYTLNAIKDEPTPLPSGSRKSKVDRRERKKEQNRNAALKYREKKRSEQDILQQEADELAEKNKGLRESVDSISREIKYLKDLMAEIEKARSKAKK